MEARTIIEEIKKLSLAEQAEVIRFVLELAGKTEKTAAEKTNDLLSYSFYGS